MPIVVAVALGGALGALARYGVDRFVEHDVVTVFPWSTFVINVSGCLLAGLLIGAIVERHEAPACSELARSSASSARTRRSRPSRKTLDLLEGEHVALGLVNGAVSVAAGVGAVALG